MLALLIAILGGLTIVTPTDIFPSINIPVVSVIWLYNGLSAQEMEGRTDAGPSSLAGSAPRAQRS